jgi:hypothetical protein
MVAPISRIPDENFLVYCPLSNRYAQYAIRATVPPGRSILAVKAHLIPFFRVGELMFDSSGINGPALYTCRVQIHGTRETTLYWWETLARVQVYFGSDTQFCWCRVLGLKNNRAGKCPLPIPQTGTAPLVPPLHANVQTHYAQLYEHYVAFLNPAKVRLVPVIPQHVISEMVAHAVGHAETCPISYEVLTKDTIAVTACGHRFSGTALATSLAAHDRCPVCRHSPCVLAHAATSSAIT